MLVTSFGGQLNGQKEFLVFWETEDSSEGLVKVATRKKAYKAALSINMHMYNRCEDVGGPGSPDCMS